MRYIVVNPPNNSRRMLDRSDVTVLLGDASAGNSEAFDELHALVYDELATTQARSYPKKSYPSTTPLTG